MGTTKEPQLHDRLAEKHLHTREDDEGGLTDGEPFMETPPHKWRIFIC